MRTLQTGSNRVDHGHPGIWLAFHVPRSNCRQPDAVLRRFLAVAMPLDSLSVTRCAHDLYEAGQKASPAP